MKKIKRYFLIVLSLVFLPTVGVINLYAGGNSQGAIIDSKETYGEFGHVLDYMNTNETLKRTQFVSFIRDWTPGSYKYQVLAPDNNIQMIKKGTLQLETGVGNTAMSIADIFTNYGIQIKLFVTEDASNYYEVTSELDVNGYYRNNVNLKGYYIELLFTRSVNLTNAVALYATNEIEIDYSKLTQRQLAGEDPLDQWLDSKYINTPPTANYQRIFVVNPVISGTVKYQKLDSEQDVPSWDSSSVIQDIPVHLVKQDGTVIATTQTKADGTFTFSNALDGATDFYLDDSLEQLFISIDGQGKKEWRDYSGTIALNNDDLSLGTIVDISKSQSIFDTAMSKTTFYSAYSGYDENGKNAVDSKYILTDLNDPQQADGNLVVKYEDELGNEIASRIEATKPEGTNYTTEQKTIANYTFKEMKSTSAPTTGTYRANETIEVVYVYEQVTNSVGNLVVKYEDEAGNEIASRVESTEPAGTQYATEQKAIANYEFKEMKSTSAPTTGVYKANETIEVVYVYKQVANSVGNLVVKYEDEAGNEIASRVESTEPAGTQYATEQKTIANYEFKEMKSTSAPTTGAYRANETIEVVYVYKQVINSVGNLVVKYEDETGNEIASRVESTEQAGTQYTTEQKTIENYTFKEMKNVSAPTTGAYRANETIEVIYVYTNNVDEKVELPKTGSNESQFLLLLGSFLTISGAYVLFILKRKNI